MKVWLLSTFFFLCVLQAYPDESQEMYFGDNCQSLGERAALYSKALAYLGEPSMRDRNSSLTAFRFLRVWSLGDIICFRVEDAGDENFFLYTSHGAWLEGESAIRAEQVRKKLSQHEVQEVKELIAKCTLWKIPTNYEDTRRAKIQRFWEKILRPVGFVRLHHLDGFDYLAELRSENVYHVVDRSSGNIDENLRSLYQYLVELQGAAAVTESVP